MIASLTGRVAFRGASHCVIEVGGVGYRLAMSTGSLAALPHVGDSVTVHTYLHIRPEELALYGFESDAERALFEKLITVSGVGPKVALAALSTWAPPALTDAVLTEDVAAISSIPGVGKKTAQRIILELKDKVGTVLAGARHDSGVGGSAVAEAREALTSMGFSAGEIASALSGIEVDSDPQGVLKAALKRLGGAS